MIAAKESSFFNLLTNAQQQAVNLAKSSRIAGLVTPKYEGQCISNLPDTFSKLLGVHAARPLSGSRFYEFASRTSVENVVFLLLDGFGFNSILQANEKFGLPAVQKIVDEQQEEESFVTPLTSVFPSTTSTATTSLHMGLTPQEHGIIGYTMYMSELGAIVQMLDMGPVFSRKSLFELNFDPATVVGRKTIHEKFAEAGIPANLYISKYIVGSGLSQITNRGANIFPTLSFSDLLVGVRKNLEAARPAFHFAYHASPDTIAHARSPFSEEYAAEVDSIFYLINRELRENLDPQIGKRTLLLISADHGLAHVQSKELIDVAREPELLKLLKVPPTGDSRCVILYAKSEDKIPRVREYFERKFSNKFHILDSRDALKQGLFGIGESKEEIYDRIGDLIAVPMVDCAVDNSNVQTRNEYVPGRHGGLSPNEMIVPLIAIWLSG